MRSGGGAEGLYRISPVALQVCVHFSISVSFSIDMQAARKAKGACHQSRRSERQFCVDVYARRDRTICLVDPSQRLHNAPLSARFTPAAATNRTPAGHSASLKTHGSSRVAASGHSQTCQHAFDRWRFNNPHTILSPNLLCQSWRLEGTATMLS